MGAKMFYSVNFEKTLKIKKNRSVMHNTNTNFTIVRNCAFLQDISKKGETMFQKIHQRFSVGSFIFGLPNVEGAKSDISLPQRRGFYELAIGSGGSPLVFTRHKPLSEKPALLFADNKGRIFVNSNVSFSFPKDMRYGDEDRVVIFGGHLVTEQGLLQQKTFISYAECVFVSENGDKIPFYNCYVAKKDRKVDTLVYDLKIRRLCDISPFDHVGKPKGYLEVSGMLHSIVLPKDVLNACYASFKEHPTKKTCVRCTGGEVIVPLYLKPLFGGLSPVFHVDGFGIEGHHGVNANTFLLLVGWLLDLVMLKKFPSCDDLIRHEMNVEEWLHVSHYFNIPILMQFFMDIQKILEDINKC